MLSRREFLAQSAVAAAGSGILATAATSASAPKNSITASKPLRILLLGGTGFIGTHLMHDALARGHKVSVQVWTGGKRPHDLPPEVERLPGDRNGDLKSIQNRDWDSVIDIATYGPLWVRTLGEALKGRVKHYTFISSVAAYADRATTNEVADENSKLMEYERAADPYSIVKNNDMYEYRTLKVLCEREAERQFPGKTLIVRPTVISGPGDNVGGLTYLCARMEAGGEMLVAGDPLQQMQLIDVRDMTAWMIRMVESGETGPFNAVGPALPMGWAEMLGAVRGTSSAPVKLTWVPVPWVTEQKVKPWNVLFWPTGVGIPGLLRMSNDKARAKGLTFRPLSVTAADTLAWFKGLPVERQGEALLGSALAEHMRIERELLAAWHARDAK